MSDLGLEPLLSALREAGLRAGVAELLRLREVFVRTPDLADLAGGDRERLRSVLRAVLVKSLDERAAFDRVFDAWSERAEREWSERSSPLPQIPAVDRSPAGRRSRWRSPGWPAAALALVVLYGALGPDTVWSPSESSPQTGSIARPFEESIQVVSRSRTAAEIRQQRFTDWVPYLKVIEAEPVWQGWPALGLGLLALASAGGLWLALRRRSWRPPAEPLPSREGPPRVFLAPAPLPGLQLLDTRQEDALVWGIGHFVAEEPTRRLDTTATVRATAREAGIPRLVFRRARYHREVWLWVDEAADDPTLLLLADEVETSLAAHGLPVARATFHGLPDRLITAEGAVFAPSEIDERRDETLVAILTDGRLLVRQNAADDRRVVIEALLRNLSHWPHLAFVSFSDGAESLRPILARHGLPLVPPAGLVAFLGGRTASLPRTGFSLSLDNAAWAAACALSPVSIAEATALQIRRRLKLATSPWALHALRTEAQAGPSGRLAWKPADRARRLNELRAAEVHPAGGIAPDSLLGRALRLWDYLYDEELRRRAGEAAAGEGTPAHQLLRMERALLRLWGEQAGEAVRELYALFQGALRDLIPPHLTVLAPAGMGGEDHIRLPWAWESRLSTEKAMLREMGLGGSVPPVRLRRPGRVWLGIAVCLGLALGGLAMAAATQERPPVGPPVLIEAAEGPQDIPAPRLRELAPGQWYVTVTSRHWVASEVTGPQARVEVLWRLENRRCVEALDGAEVWRCGSRGPSSSSLLPVIRRSAIALRAVPGTSAAETLALALLDSGSADVVFLGTNWPRHRTAVVGGLPSNPDQQELVVPGASWSSLERALSFTGVRTVARTWPVLKIWDGDPEKLYLRGSLSCRPGEEVTVNGVVFVRICPGTFTMGSAADDHLVTINEEPAHQVTLSEFWIGKTEVTNAHYQPDHGGWTDLPVTEVSWFEAQAFCADLGGRLPTEAEWEYAARAGTRTPWSFGSDEGQIGKYAWFGENSGLLPHPVGTREPNPWGLHDMHGNVWEWVEDWFGNYILQPQTDPTGPTSGQYRVLRGGSVDYGLRVLRSAFRVGVEPANRNRDIGFRCVLASRRQS